MCDIQFWATVISPIIGTIAIVVAFYVSRRASKEATQQIEEIRKSTEKQVEALKDIVAHQGDIAWVHLQHYYMQNKFEFYEDQRELAVIQRKKSKKWTKDQELDTLEEWLTLRIKNRKELLDNYETLIKDLDESTESILYEKSQELKQ
jgi:type III secretory pathway component EscR